MVSWCEHWTLPPRAWVHFPPPPPGTFVLQQDTSSTCTLLLSTQVYIKWGPTGNANVIVVELACACL